VRNYAPRHEDLLRSRHYTEVRGRLHVLADLLQGKSPSVPLYRRLSGAESRSKRCEVDKKTLAHAGNRTPVLQPVARRLNLCMRNVIIFKMAHVRDSSVGIAMNLGLRLDKVHLLVM
jgi:hypothetical protein